MSSTCEDTSAMLAAIARGAIAGLAGATAMSVSTNAEMRLRGRPPSYAPAQVIGRVLGVSTRGERRKKTLGTVGHLATAVPLGVVRGLLDRLGLGPRPAGLVLFGIAMTPEVLVVPALGAADPPWQWSGADAAVSILHHAVYATATNAAYQLLTVRAANPPATSFAPARSYAPRGQSHRPPRGHGRSRS